MAHSDETKANALVMLLTGDSPYYVAKQTGVPLTTVKRWRNKDMKQILRECIPPEVIRSIRAAFRQLWSVV